MSDEVKKIFAENLSRLLDEKGYQQTDLAEVCDVSSSTTSDWVNGNKMPRMNKIQTMADWLGVQKSDLLERYRPHMETSRYQEILFDTTQDATPEDMENIIAMVKAYMRKK